jgi:GAF domain-containing protein
MRACLKKASSRATELDERSQRLALLNRFSSALSGLLDEGKILQLTAQELMDALNAPNVSVVSVRAGQCGLEICAAQSQCRTSAKLPDAPIFHRLKESLGVSPLMLWMLNPTFSVAQFPGRQDKSLLYSAAREWANLRALIFIHQNKSVRFSLTEIELARTLTNQASIALENARLYQSTLSTADRFSILNQASYQVGANLDPEQIYTAVHKAAERLMPVESFVISLLDEETMRSKAFTWWTMTSAPDHPHPA